MNLFCRLFTVIFLLVFGYVRAEGTVPETTPVKPTPTVKIDLHTDWFNVKYDDVRENTIIKPKDDLGPGAPARTSASDNLKIGIAATVPGKSFDPNNPVAIVVSFNRMAGLMQKANQDSLFGTKQEDDYKPFSGNQVQQLDKCADVLLVLPSGQKIQVKPGAVSYKTIKNEGFMGEKYIWESLSISGGMELLDQLQDGAKVALCDTTFAMVKDQISEVRSIQSLVKGLAPKPASK